MEVATPPRQATRRIGPEALASRDDTHQQALRRALAATDAGPTYEIFYGLHEKPFSPTSDLNFLYHSMSHDRAAQEILSAIGRRDPVVVLTGETGTGKTTLCRAVIEEIDRRTFTSFVSDPFVTAQDLLQLYRPQTAPGIDRALLAEHMKRQITFLSTESGDLSAAAMRRAARDLVGQRDFASFGRRPEERGASTVRRLERLSVSRAGDHLEIAHDPEIGPQRRRYDGGRAGPAVKAHVPELELELPRCGHLGIGRDERAEPERRPRAAERDHHHREDSAPTGTHRAPLAAPRQVAGEGHFRCVTIAFLSARASSSDAPFPQ